MPLIGASEGAGYRPVKWAVDQEDLTGGMRNDFVFFRLAEIYLIKAEALWRLHGPNQQSLDLINRLRRRAFAPDQLSGPNDHFGDDKPEEQVFDPDHLITMAEANELGWEQLFLDARTRELHSEGKRRQDLTRFGVFTSSSWLHRDPTSEPWRVVFPIPQSQLDANPNLTQNPGY